jgi:hypothetical protein
MATIINNPGERVDSGSGAGVILAIIVAVVLALLLLLYGVPGLRGTAPATDNSGGASLDVNIGGGTGTDGAGTGGTNGQ